MYVLAIYIHHPFANYSSEDHIEKPQKKAAQHKRNLHRREDNLMKYWNLVMMKISNTHLVMLSTRIYVLCTSSCNTFGNTFLLFGMTFLILVRLSSLLVRLSSFLIFSVM